jgi:tryptophan-rich sensory protein
MYVPVWTLLYAQMAIAASQVRQASYSLLRTMGITQCIVQLALNLAWSWMFFHEHEIGVALSNVILLWAVVALTTVLFREVTPSAAWLMLPYLAWLTFAMILNIEFWRLNRS